jgi:2-succinyl-5-enolpyruvyl-6-hydroxy-3-cyclohexene-1-carboxylate synthase
MISTKRHIQQLAAILLAHEIEDIVISPGSRNGPLTHTFAGSGKFNCRNIVDERSAGYFAIGLSQSTKKPVVLVCSSGTATLNYAPAVAEAFYLNIPLIILTADRPSFWINQGESQCIPQENIYQDFTKKEVSLPLGESEQELWHAKRLCNECFNEATNGTRGPVHINIPLDEPLHDILDDELPTTKATKTANKRTELTEKEWSNLSSVFNQSKKVLILAGQQNPNPELENILAELIEKKGAVILKEHLSNLNHPNFCSSIDTTMTALLSEKISDFQPDLLISFGGQFVSKSLKQFLRKNKPGNHWHLSPSNEHFDTYQSLSKVITTDALDFFSQLSGKVNSKEKIYWQRWKNKETEVNHARDKYLKQIDFSDLKVFKQVCQSIPENSIVHLGNSTPVRYALICENNNSVQYLGNRGTSGIDGSLSTAVGFASSSEKINTIILGDLSFFYDSNALWNKYINSNLRVIVINNRGGNIFGLIKGLSESPAFNEHFFTENKYKAEGIAKTFDLDYFKAGNEKELEIVLKDFYSDKQNKAALLEIFTDTEINTKVFRGLFKNVKIKTT